MDMDGNTNIINKNKKSKYHSLFITLRYLLINCPIRSYNNHHLSYYLNLLIMKV